MLSYKAVAKLLDHPPAAVRLIGDRLKPAGPVDRQRINALVLDLASPQFAVRQKATFALEALGELAESAYRKSLAEPPSDRSSPPGGATC